MNLPRSHEHVLFMLKSSESVRNVRMRLQCTWKVLLRIIKVLEQHTDRREAISNFKNPKRMEKDEKDGKGIDSCGHEHVPGRGVSYVFADTFPARLCSH